VPEHIGRHSHPKAPPEVEPEPVALTGVDYIALLAAADRAETAGRLHLSHLADPTQPAPADTSDNNNIDGADDGVGGQPQ
jgi:putative transposase